MESMELLRLQTLALLDHSARLSSAALRGRRRIYRGRLAPFGLRQTFVLDCARRIVHHQGRSVHPTPVLCLIGSALSEPPPPDAPSASVPIGNAAGRASAGVSGRARPGRIGGSGGNSSSSTLWSDCADRMQPTPQARTGVSCTACEWLQVTL